MIVGSSRTVIGHGDGVSEIGGQTDRVFEWLALLLEWNMARSLI